MAEVLAPIVQQPSSINMLQSSDAFQNSTQAQQRAPSSRSAQAARVNLYQSQNGILGLRSTAAAPVAPYAFNSTPHLRQETRPVGGVTHQQQPGAGTTAANRVAPLTSSPSLSAASSNSSSNRSKDDSVISRSQRTGPTADSRPKSLLSLSTPDLTLPNFETPAKPSPDRYRRGQRRTESSGPAPTTAPVEAPVPARQATPSGSGMANVAHLYQDALSRPPVRAGHLRSGSFDDMSISRQSSDQAKRYRRRSMSGFEPSMFTATLNNSAPLTALPPAAAPRKDGHVVVPNQARTTSTHERNNSGESGSSAGTANRPSSSRRDSTTPSPRPASPTAKAVNAPSRGAVDKRLTNPSPLSKSAVGVESPSPARQQPAPAAENATPPSSAAQHLQAVTDKDAGKGKKSRLRRAFSFGSAAELRRATTENNHERSKLQKHRTPEEEREAEHEAIAAQQEAAGIGASIYSGQGGFVGSTDNISISSTASSASVMLRKMGKGMKKGGRSLKGLFRPKSVVGVPPADGPVTPMAQVSMVTVEAEREKVNVNVNPHDQVGGGTGFPKLERNSLDVNVEAPGSSNGVSPGKDSWARKSIVGGERERAEVLAAVKKGILKRSGTGSSTSSPTARVLDGRAPELTLPSAPHVSDSPRSSAPSTPNDDHPRSVPVTLSGEDYFLAAARFTGSTKSLPNTPQSRNISFSPRIQFHDAWSATEYDRRGDIATCNRLTPMLAQQIKEELNTFKMEMEVHEQSKPHTHFF